MSAAPQGMSTITPSLNLKNAAKAIELYKKALGAKEVAVMKDPKSGKIMHAILSIGESQIFVADEFPGCAATNSSFYVYVDDVDASFDQAKSAGLKETMAPEDMFWGDRTGNVVDEFGVNWCLATHTRDVSPEEIEKGRDEWLAKMEKKKAAA